MNLTALRRSTMARLRLPALLAVLAILAAVASPADAISPTCFPDGLPTEPVPPVLTTQSTWASTGTFRVEVWRQVCVDDPASLAVLLRATPIAGSPFVCYSNFTIIQDSQQVEAGLSQIPGSNSFCVPDLFVPTTLSLERRDGAPFDPGAAFALIVKGTAEVTVNVPAAGPAPFGVAIVAAGCTTCGLGQLAQFRVRVTNPGPPFVAELKTAAHLPDGSVVSVLGRHVEEIIQSGEYEIPLVAVKVFELTPQGVYTLEVALVDPVTGVTLARSSRQASVQ